MKISNIKNTVFGLCKTWMFTVLLTGSMFSCSDQLEEEVFDFYSKDEYFTNNDRLEMAVNGVYETFSDINNYGQSWQVYDTDTDISHVKGAGIGHTARDLGHYNAYATHSWLEESWMLYYRGIDRANTILEKQNDVVLNSSSDSIRFNKLIAQTKSLRAMCYFDLTILFGDVPLKLTASKDGDDLKMPKTPRSEVYDQIVKDFKEAIPHLAWKEDAERISKGAAIGLLARAYLFRGGYSLYDVNGNGEMKRPDNYKEYYTEANKLLDELMNSGHHGLLENYERVFRNMCELKYDPFENICEISFFTPTGQKKGASVQGTYNGPEIAQTSVYGRANSFIKTHNFFYDTFESDDLRRDVAIATFRITAENVKQGKDVVSELPRKQSYNWAPGKWRRNWHTGAVKDNNNTDVNYLLLRYADILLMRAEIENELNNGPTDIAIECINQVRRRAFGQPYQSPNSELDFAKNDFSNQEDFFNYIYAERARELCFEGMRRMDLVRWNLLGKAIKDTQTKFTDAIAEKKLNDYTFEAGNRFTANKHELYPIPAYDIRETNGAITQNPGY